MGDDLGCNVNNATDNIAFPLTWVKGNAIQSFNSWVLSTFHHMIFHHMILSWTYHLIHGEHGMIQMHVARIQAHLCEGSMT